MSTPKILIMMADYGHDPTETAVPYIFFKNAGFEVQFATETGKPPQCDERMLKGLTQKLLGAKQSTIDMYNTMIASSEHQHPLSWSAPGFSLDEFNLLLFPGGHDKSVRQILDSETVHRLVAEYFPQTRKDAGSKKAVAAVCHGVLVLAESKRPEDGKSVIHECKTTTLPGGFESAIFWGTRAFLGDYYKTYGAGSENAEETVRKNLSDKALWKSSLGMSPFVVEDDTYNYISARFPGDAELFAEKIVKLVESFFK